MDLALSEHELAFRDEVRVWLADNLPEGWGLTGYREPETFDEKLQFARGWERQLADAGWAGISWPKEYGGRGATLGVSALISAREGERHVLGEA